MPTLRKHAIRMRKRPRDKTRGLRIAKLGSRSAQASVCKSQLGPLSRYARRHAPRENTHNRSSLPQAQQNDGHGTQRQRRYRMSCPRPGRSAFACRPCSGRIRVRAAQSSSVLAQLSLRSLRVWPIHPQPTRAVPWVWWSRLARHLEVVHLITRALPPFARYAFGMDPLVCFRPRHAAYVFVHRPIPRRGRSSPALAELHNV